MGGRSSAQPRLLLRLLQQDEAARLIGGGRTAAAVVRGQRQERDLAGRSVSAPQELALMHDARADACADGDHGERLQLLRRALPLLADGGEVDVVVQEHLRLQRLRATGCGGRTGSACPMFQA